MEKLKIGFAGLGRMGFNMVSRILSSGIIDVVVYNRSPQPVLKAEKLGAIPSDSIHDLVEKLGGGTKIIWMMLPSGEVTENYFNKILNELSENDILIDGGNSNFNETLRRGKKAEEKNVFFLDAGVSGGIIAAQRGYPVMVGGNETAYRKIVPFLETFCAENGYGLVGPSGSGHYVKMVHNAIEYGMMQAIGEGFDLLKHGQFDNLDLNKVSGIWNHGTIISGFLMEMVGNALEKRQNLEDILPVVEDSGEGRWAAMEAVNHGVPFAINTLALHSRFSSQNCNTSFGMKLVSAMRNEFGGHKISLNSEK
ncbi:MAG: decarboxylating 6-phosphogluconate dehydrogenase [Deltaproteobacteria bacterium]|nr:decarboxylating 6-phosphogluconate dehydrogenase [Deltaproteobacteria bacterium]